MQVIRRNWFVVSFVCLAWGTAFGQMPSVKVVVSHAEMRDAPATITLVATVLPVRRSQVASEVAGIVAAMPVRQGDPVEKGGVLCRLNADALSFRHAEAIARLAALKARHEELLAGTRPEELARVKALADAAGAEVARWSAEMERVDKLYTGSESNPKELYDTRASLLGAMQRKRAADADYALAVDGPRVEVVARAAHDVAEQQAVADRLAGDLAKTSIRAPFSGFVVDRTVETGEWVASGGRVVELVDLSSVLVRVDAPEHAFRFIRVGDSVRVHIDALGESLVGTVRHVIRQADVQARTFPVEIEVLNEDGRLAAGMFARATVASGPSEQVVAVPKDAIVERDGITYVGTVMPGHGGTNGMLMPVTLGSDVAEWVAITSGNVREGMQLIIRGTERLRPFPGPVIIVDEHGTPVAPPVDPAKGGHGEGA